MENIELHRPSDETEPLIEADFAIHVIVHWTDVESPEMVGYLLQATPGAKIQGSPAVPISREVLLKLTRGAEALLGEMIQREPNAMSDLWMPSAPPTVVGLAGFIARARRGSS